MNERSCRIYDNLRAGFHIRQRFCRNAATCTKTREGCFALADLKAQEEAASVGTEEDVAQILALKKLEEEAKDTTSSQA